METALSTTEIHKEAVELHLRIKTTWQIISNSLVEFCRLLKDMRDKQLYKELGYESFDTYTEAEVNLRPRQAYYYISTYERLGAQMIEENSGLGITKLRIVADVPALDRASFLEEHNIESLTAEELRKKLKEAYGTNEQLTLQLENFDNDGAKPEEAVPENEWSERLRTSDEARAAAEAELAAIKENAKDTGDVDLEALRSGIIEELSEQMKADAEAAAEKEKEKAIKAAKKEAAKEATAKAKVDTAKEIEKAKVDAAKEAEKKIKAETDKKLAALEAEATVAKQRATKLEKEMNLNASKETTAFALHFDQFQQHFSKMIELIEIVKSKGDVDGAEKLKTALKKGMDMLKTQLCTGK